MASMDIFDLTGQKALVTGAGNESGIGMAIARAYRERGATVAVLSRGAGVFDVAKTGGFSAIQADLADREALKRGFDEAIAQLGTLDILVNCHGITHLQKAEEFPIEVWDQMLEINLTSVFLLCQLAGRVMLDKGRGKIINIASMLSFVGGTLAPSYAASKAGLAQLTKALSNEWAGRGINVNAIAPGYIDTEMTRPRLTANPERKRQILERIPIGRLGTSEELMGIAVFLAARASDYVCGAVIPVDGGFLAR